MTNITGLSSYAAAHPRPLPTAAPQQSGNTITLRQALARGVTANQLHAVADWNERKSYDERRRKARHRHKAQATALRAVADELERGGMREAA
ncbi:MAG: hypothetical protein WBB98_04895 [Xanthobacteraceae bacterium]